MLRILLIVPIYAASVLTGGGQRSLHIFRAFAAHGEVDVLLVSEAPQSRASAETNTPDLRLAVR